MNRLTSIILAVLFVVASAVTAQATTYYASNAGNNANTCVTAQSGGASAKRTVTCVR